MPAIELLVIQPTPFCNINCSYCYLPDRQLEDGRIVEETLSNLFSEVFASGWVQDLLSVVWHAGEPMVLPTVLSRCVSDHRCAEAGRHFGQPFIPDQWNVDRRCLVRLISRERMWASASALTDRSTCTTEIA